MTANAGIIAHLRSGGSRVPEQHLPVVSNNSSISSFLRRRSSAQSAPPTPMRMTYKPTPEQLGLKGPFLHAGRAGQANNIAWMDKSFLINLRNMLQDIEVAGSGNRDAVSWEPTGDRFTIRDKTFFATSIAPRYFSIFSNSTFRLVAQSWGFVVETDQKGFESYHHPGFLRDDQTKCQNLSMQEMKELAISMRNAVSSTTMSNNNNVDDPLLLLAATAESHQEATPNPQGSKDAMKKNITQEKSGVGSNKKSSVIKARRASLNNALPLGTARRSSLNNTMGSSLNVPSRSSLTNTFPRRGSTGICVPQSKTSATVALLKSRRHNSLSDSVIAPFAGLHMSPRRASPTVNNLINKQRFDKTTAMELNMMMQKGAAVSTTSFSGHGSSVSDHLRNKMR